MLRIDFDRLNPVARCEGMEVRRPVGDEPLYALLRLLADHGYSGPATAYDERGMACLTFRCVRAAAMRYFPTAEEIAARKQQAVKTKPARKK